MTNFKALKGVLFDLDGVICDTARLHAQAWSAIAKKVGTTWTPQLQASLAGIDRMHSLDLIIQAGNGQHQFSEAEKQALATEKNTQYLALVADLKPTDILPGVRIFLDQLQQHGYQIALASSSKNAPLVLKHLGLSDFFSEVVDPATLTHGKPNGEIYAKAAALLNLEPAQCLGIEDAAAGVDAINNAGAVSVGIGDAQTLAKADVVFPSTAELTLANIERGLAGEARG
ncbi:beta-phosphoglucomutase [Lacticaseibacillus manihotivorans]|jgi:beta-phosphoglucomutase|uniref:Beta-phosphoglucomutase n=2 Tax=Lacticaseibacillus manihotivorans TaxID=88233 RepID=A0A0R1QMS9_9LACO|nr:beta-phosphoglucomutase [Lacticaseibacillus manihotivorans]KRL46080.1 beta-phosphoglucomutase [Lacticaseibacillus manihotivorans DSM 13343 = JCM 12514]QFQ92041.1 beta-phosphoglucomutase [Lacticaseibacillus manihotivorans]